MSQREFAGLADLTGAEVSRFERGDRLPTAAVAKRIEAATNGEVSATELLGIDSPGRHGVREDAAAFEKETAVAVPVPDGLLRAAREQNLDIPALLAKGGIPALEAESRRVFRERNADLIAWNRKHVEEHGTLSQRFGMI